MKSLFLSLSLVIIVLGCSVSSSKSYKSLKVKKIIRVYDGDTFYVNLKKTHPLLGENIGIRINGIDTPEMRGSSPCVKEMAVKAKDFLEKRLKESRSIKLLNCERGKYFRIIADVSVDGRDIADELIQKGYAIPYDGGTKSKWTCQKN